MIRAEEHLSNTPRQIFIARSLGYELPQYAHLPFVAEPGSKNKLSKRKLDKYLKNPDFAQLMKHGRKVAEALRLAVRPRHVQPGGGRFLRAGRLPARRGDQLPGPAGLVAGRQDARIFRRRQLIESFSLERVNKSAASFDPAKLWAFQLRHMQRLPVAEKAALVVPYLQRAGLVPSPLPDDLRPKVEHVVAAAGDRIKTAGDVLDFDYFFLPDDRLAYDEKALEKWLRPARGRRAAGEVSRSWLAAVEPFDAQHLEEPTHAFVEAEGESGGDILHGSARWP